MFIRFILMIAIFSLSLELKAQSDQTEEVEDKIELLDDSSSFAYTVILYNGPDPIEGRKYLDRYNSSFSKVQKSKFESCPPNYKVSVGEFYTRLEGYRFWVKIKDDFNTSILAPILGCE